MNKLQELTDRLYNEGLSKGKAEGEAILADAKEKSGQMIEESRKQAEAIVAAARKEAEALKAKVDSDLKTAASQAIAATKKDIENLLVGGISEKGVKDCLGDAGFVKEMIKAVASKFSSEGGSDLELVLPESLKGELEPFVSGELASFLGKGVKAAFSKKIAGGFNIAPKDGGYFISLSDETFKALISEYLRPVTKKILFG